MSDHVVAANSYLMWAEKAEHRLLTTFDDYNVARQLQSDRYWQIRGMASATSRPMPLIYAEIKVQARHLDDLLRQLQHYISLLALPLGHWIVVPDTNVYIHGQLFHEVEWHREIGARYAVLAMPLVVLDELDRIKDRDHQYSKRARSVLRALDGLTGDNWLKPIRLRQSVSLQLLDEPSGHRRQPSQDDEIVRQAAYFAHVNENRLTIVTRDRGMRLRAHASGLTVMALPAHLERIRIANDE
jgi:rRNA-processing protein FCF1